MGTVSRWMYVPWMWSHGKMKCDGRRLSSVNVLCTKRRAREKRLKTVGQREWERKKQGDWKWENLRWILKSQVWAPFPRTGFLLHRSHFLFIFIFIPKTEPVVVSEKNIKNDCACLNVWRFFYNVILSTHFEAQEEECSFILVPG